MSGGTSCAYRGCSLRTGQGVSLFCFPKDHEQAKKWIEACYRTDLIPKIEILHKNYKLCEQHFEEKHISKTGTSRRRLLPNAIPTLFAHNLKREVQEVPITSEVDKSKDDSYKIIIISAKEEPMTVDSCLEDEASNSTSSDEDDDDVNEKLIRKADELEKQISSNEYLYDAHVEIVNLYRRIGDLTSMRAAYERFQEKFPLTPKLWLDWLRDEIKIANTPDERQKVFTLFDRAVEDYLSVELWVEYAKFSVGASDLNTTRSILERGLTSAGLHVSEGSLLWDTLRDIEHAHISFYPENSEEWTHQVQRLGEVFKRQLSVPLMNIANTYQEWQDWHRTLPAGLIDSKPIQWAYKKSAQLLDTYMPFEERLLAAESTEHIQDIYKEYIQVVKDPSMVLCLYERAVTTLCLSPKLWQEYCKYAFKLGEVADKVSSRALRNCPWCEDLWIVRLRIMEKLNKEEKEVLACFEQGLSSVSSSLELWLSYLEYSCRNGKDTAKLDKLFQQALQMTEQMDPTCKLIRWYARWLARRGEMAAARKKWHQITEQPASKGLASVWLEYANLERQYGDPSHVRSIFKKALHACQDWLQCIADEWLMFEREFGTLEDVMRCCDSCESATQGVLIKSETNLQTQTQESCDQSNERRGKNRKRKTSTSAVTDNESKKAKLPRQVQEKAATVAPPVVPSRTIDKDPKRTVFVSNLHPSVDDRQLKELFPNAVQIEVARDRKGKSRCFGYVRFDKEEEVLVALARDRAPIDGRPVFISEVKPEKTERKPVFKYATAVEENKLFVKGLPVNKTNEEVKAIFLPYNPKDVRLVMKRTGQSKGIAFVDFETVEEAQRALKQLDQTDVDGHIISVAISAPPSKQAVDKTPVDEPIRHARSRLQVPMVPRSVQVKKEVESSSGSENGGGTLAKPKSNADFRNLLLNK